MSSKAIKEKPDEVPAAAWGTPEAAPSSITVDEPSLARWVGLLGLTCFTIGVVAFIFNAVGWTARIGTGLGSALAAVGLGALLYHAVRDADQQVRRAYGLFALVWMSLALIFTLVPTLGFLPWGSFFLLTGLLFAVAFIRNETDDALRQRAILVLGGVGGGLAVAGMYGALLSMEFFLPGGLVLALLGLAYLWAFLGFLDPANDFRDRAGTGMAVIGLLVLVHGLARSLIPFLASNIPFFASILGVSGRGTDSYFQTVGLLEIYVGVMYLGVSLGLCSDHPFVTMTRRELVSFFYSPIAYIVLVGFALAGLAQYGIFIFTLTRSRGGIMEPVVGYYIVSWLMALCILLIVPILTMRLFSEEKRTATFEVLLTAPVRDLPIVLSKFTAVLIFFLVTWMPIGLFLVGFRIDGGRPFDAKPLVGFSLGLICSGANFLAMGLFFSSLTKNQIIAAGLTAVGMLVHIACFFVWQVLRNQPSLGQFMTIVTGFLEHISYLNLWISSMSGKLPVQDLLLHVSGAVFWLFLTVKVLETRKWS